MKRTYLPLLAFMAGAGAAGLLPSAWGSSVFEAEPLAEGTVMITSQPLSNNQWRLMVIEASSPDATCWREHSGGRLEMLNAAANTQCQTYTSSSGYSARVDGNDLSRSWRLRVEPAGNQLILELINPATDMSLVVGRAPRSESGMTAFVLESGWQPAKRTYQGKALQHLYLNNSDPLPALMARARHNGNLIARPPALPPALPGAGPVARASSNTAYRSGITTSTGPIALQVIPYRP